MRMSLRRREFLGRLAAVLASGPLRGWSQDLPAALSHERLRELFHRLLETPDDALRDFAVATYEECVLGKLRSPAPPLAHPWLVPGGGYYAQWLWDTMFVADLLAVLPGQEATLRGVFSNYWEFQRRWDAEKPAAQHGMIANFIAPFEGRPERDGKQWRTFPAYSQAPLLAWGMERVYKRTRDMQMVREGLGPLEAFHEWYWRERDVSGVGMVGVGSYSGDAQHARYETYDREVDLDGLKMTPHPARPQGENNGAWYGDILIPANTAYLLLSELSLAGLAKVAGKPEIAARRMARYSKGKVAMQRHMWSQKDGCFKAVRRDSLQQIVTATVGGFMPLMARVPTDAQARRMAEALDGADWKTPLPIPTVARSNAEFQSGEFWRGDVWPAPNYQVATGLAAYGLRKTAARIADTSFENALKVGISERYDSLSGAPLGVKGLGMSATVLTMAFDGLTSERFRLRVRRT